ncbi:DNA-binding transcriptional LysR family regulator [Sphingomonas zeicaulis]|uniref:LysR family transcriptional regulator n=1 Tax=Sphingomonas zeicaulis TaxID=1632740 RepID=UPI003D207756
MSDVSLTDLNAFAAVAQYRSFRRAADALGVSRSALSHAVRALEARLGARLLHRTTRSVAPTEAGETLLARLVPTLRDLDEMLDAVGQSGAELTGTLRINANEGGAGWLLQHVVPSFLQRHPRAAIDLVSEGRLVDIVAEGFDAGVRLREAVPQDMIAVPFAGAIRFLPVAAPAYVAAHGRPQSPEDLRRHRCIRQRLPSGKPYRWEFVKGTQELAVEVPGSIILDHSRLMVDAAILGLGIAFVPEPYAADALADDRLVPLLEEWCPWIEGLCLYYAGNRHVPAVLRAFIDVLRQSGD